MCLGRPVGVTPYQGLLGFGSVGLQGGLCGDLGLWLEESQSCGGFCLCVCVRVCLRLSGFVV